MTENNRFKECWNFYFFKKRRRILIKMQSGIKELVFIKLDKI
jgi:hypothetical protein